MQDFERRPRGRNADHFHAFAQQDVSHRAKGNHQKQQTISFEVKTFRRLHAFCVSLGTPTGGRGSTGGAETRTLFCTPFLAIFRRSWRSFRKSTASWKRRLRSCESQSDSRTI